MREIAYSTDLLFWYTNLSGSRVAEMCWMKDITSFSKCLITTEFRVVGAVGIWAGNRGFFSAPAQLEYF